MYKSISPLNSKDGRISLDTRYELQLTPSLQFKAKQLSVELAALALEQHKQPLLRLENLRISDTQFDLAGQQLQLGKLRATSSALGLRLIKTA